MATNFSPCKGSYVLNQFPSNVMFAMNGFTYQPVERYRAIMALLFHSDLAAFILTVVNPKSAFHDANFQSRSRSDCTKYAL